MAIQTICGFSIERLADPWVKEFIEALEKGRGDTFVYIVRTAERKRHIEKLALGKLGALGTCHLYSLDNFVEKLLATRRIPAITISEAQKRLFLLEIVSGMEEKEAGFPFKGADSKPGYIEQLSRFITKLKQLGLYDGNKAKVALKKYSPKPKTTLWWAIEVLDKYHLLLVEKMLYDPDGKFIEVIEELIRQISEGGVRVDWLVKDPRVMVVEGYYEMNPVQERLFNLLQSEFEQIVFLMDSPLPVEDKAGSAPTKETLHTEIMASLKKLGAAFESVDTHRDEPPDILAMQVRGLAPGTPLTHGRFRDKLSISNPATREDEVCHIARQIRRLKEQGENFSGIAVSFGELSIYAPLVEEIFPRFDIPFRSTSASPLKSTRVARAVLDLLQLPTRAFSRQAIIKIIESPYMRFDWGNEALSGDDIPAINTLSVKAGIESTQPMNKKAWEEAFGRLKRKKNYSKAIEKIEGSVLRLINEFPAPGDTFTPSGFSGFVRSILEKAHIIEEALKNTGTGSGFENGIAAHNAEALKGIYHAIDEVERAFSFSGEKSTSFADGVRSLMEVISAISVAGARLTRADSVSVLGRLDTRGMVYEHLFVGGLVEGEYPQWPRRDIFLSSAQARTLGLKPQSFYSMEARHILTANLVAGTKYVSLSAPMFEGDKPLAHCMALQDIIEHLHDEASFFHDNGPSEPYTLEDHHACLGHAFNNGNEASIEAAYEKLNRRDANSAISALAGIEATLLRQTSKVISEFDGMLSTASTKALTADRYDKDTYEFSASMLEKYAACPIKFFFDYCMGLKPLDEVEAEPSASDLGAIIHRILQRLYKDNSNEEELKELLASWGKPEWEEKASGRLTRIANEEFGRLNARTLYASAIKSELIGPNEAAEPLFDKFIQEEIDCAESGVKPIKFEAKFGRSAKRDKGSDKTGQADLLSESPATLKAGKTSFLFTGSIDRVEVIQVGEHRDALLVWDYKTGNKIAPKQIKLGLKLQLPLYMAALDELMKPRVTRGGGFYHLRGLDTGRWNYLCPKDLRKNPAFKGRGNPLTDDIDDLEDFKSRSVKHAAGLIEGINSGVFHTTSIGPGDSGCQICDYRLICRVDHSRMKAAEKDSLVNQVISRDDGGCDVG